MKRTIILYLAAIFSVVQLSARSTGLYGSDSVLTLHAPNFGLVSRGNQPFDTVYIRNHTDATLTLSAANLAEFAAVFVWTAPPPMTIPPNKVSKWTIQPKNTLQPNAANHNTPIRFQCQYHDSAIVVEDIARITIKNEPPISIRAADKIVTVEYGDTAPLPQARLALINRHRAPIAYSVRVTPASLFNIYTEDATIPANSEISCYVEPKSSTMAAGANHWAIVEAIYAGGYAARDTILFKFIVPHNNCNAGAMAAMNPASWQYKSAAGEPYLLSAERTAARGFRYAYESGAPMMPPTTSTPVGTYLVKTTIDATDACPAIDVQAAFEITKRNINDDAVRIAAIAPQHYTGSAIMPLPAIYDGQRRLRIGEDYTIAYYDNIYAGEARIAISGINNYSGYRNAFFMVTQQTSSMSRTAPSPSPSQSSSGSDPLGTHNLSNEMFWFYNGSCSGGLCSPDTFKIAKLSRIFYNGVPQKPPLTITYGTGSISTCDSFSSVPIRNECYYVRYSGNDTSTINAAITMIYRGVNISGDIGTINLRFSILPPQSDTMLQITAFNDSVLDNYTAKTDTIKVRSKWNAALAQCSVVVQPSSKFTLQGSGAIDLPARGNGILLVTSAGNLAVGAHKAYITIYYLDSLYTRDSGMLYVKAIPPPPPSGSLVISDINATITYGDNSERSITIQNTHTSAIQFGVDISNTTQFLKSGELQSTITIPAGTTNQYCCININPPVNAGTYNTTLSDSYNLSTATINIIVQPFNISGCTIENIPSQNYAGGAEVRPTPMVSCTLPSRTETLTAGRDFVYGYDNNIDQSTQAKVIITGNGNYTGSNEQLFSIVKPPATRANFTYSCSDIEYDGNSHTIAATPNSGTGDIIERRYYKWDTITNSFSPNSIIDVVTVGRYKLVVNVSEGTDYAAATDLELCDFQILASIPRVVDTAYIKLLGSGRIFIFDYKKYEDSILNLGVTNSADMDKVIKVYWYVDKLQRCGYIVRDNYLPPPYLIEMGNSHVCPAPTQYNENEVCSYHIEVYTIKHPLVPARSADIGKTLHLVGQQTQTNAAIRAYPSVAGKNQTIRIEIDNEHVGQNADIYDIQGRLVRSQKLNDATTDIYLNEPAGTYFIIVGALYTKIVIN
jgi:hypothetical protein